MAELYVGLVHYPIYNKRMDGSGLPPFRPLPQSGGVGYRRGFAGKYRRNPMESVGKIENTMIFRRKYYETAFY